MLMGPSATELQRAARAKQRGVCRTKPENIMVEHKMAENKRKYQYCIKQRYIRLLYKHLPSLLDLERHMQPPPHQIRGIQTVSSAKLMLQHPPNVKPA